MEEPKSFCIPSIHPNICSALESIKGRSSSNTDNSALENTSPSFVLQKPNFPSNSKQLTDIALRPRTGASDGENPQASRWTVCRNVSLQAVFQRQQRKYLVRH